MATWLTAISQIGTLIIGIAVVIIARQQRQLAGNKLRLDLFDRRYKIYDATRKFLALIVREATFNDAQLFDFYADTSDAEFLFDEQIVNYLEQLRHRALNMRVYRRQYENLPVGEPRSRLVEKEHNELNWFTDQLTAVASVFKPFLGFSQIKLT